MLLSEAILKGATLRPQYIPFALEWVDALVGGGFKEGDPVATSAIGGALEAAGLAHVQQHGRFPYLKSWNGLPLKNLIRQTWDVLGERVTETPYPCGCRFIYPFITRDDDPTVMDVVHHLGLDRTPSGRGLTFGHQWTREQIAWWIASLERK